MLYYSNFKRKEILTHATTWFDLEGIVVSKISTEKNQRMIPLTWFKFIEMEHGITAARDQEKREINGLLFNQYRVWPWEKMKKVPEMESGDGCMTRRIYLRSLNTLKMVNCGIFI
jgi:hypothetical protein